MPRLIKVIKDILIIAVTITLAYIALNNTYVRPHIVNIDDNAISGNWHIYKKEHKILMGISGHTFLELSDSEGNTVEQIHGFAYDSVNNEMVESAIRNGFKLKVFNFDYNFYRDEDYTSAFPAVTLMSDNMNAILDTWSKARECGDLINARDINYPRYGFKIISETENSNSVAHSIALCAGLTDRQIGLLSPGARTILLPQ